MLKAPTKMSCPKWIYNTAFLTIIRKENCHSFEKYNDETISVIFKWIIVVPPESLADFDTIERLFKYDAMDQMGE